MALLAMALQMALCCVGIGLAVFGVMWLVFHLADYLERKGE